MKAGTLFLAVVTALASCTQGKKAGSSLFFNFWQQESNFPIIYKKFTIDFVCWTLDFFIRIQMVQLPFDGVNCSQFPVRKCDIETMSIRRRCRLFFVLRDTFDSKVVRKSTCHRHSMSNRINLLLVSITFLSGIERTGTVGGVGFESHCYHCPTGRAQLSFAQGVKER